MACAINPLDDAIQHALAALVSQLHLAELYFGFYSGQGGEQFMRRIGGKALLAFQRQRQPVQEIVQGRNDTLHFGRDTRRIHRIQQRRIAHCNLPGEHLQRFQAPGHPEIQQRHSERQDDKQRQQGATQHAKHRPAGVAHLDTHLQPQLCQRVKAGEYTPVSLRPSRACLPRRTAERKSLDPGPGKTWRVGQYRDQVSIEPDIERRIQLLAPGGIDNNGLKMRCFELAAQPGLRQRLAFIHLPGEHRGYVFHQVGVLLQLPVDLVQHYLAGKDECKGGRRHPANEGEG